LKNYEVEIAQVLGSLETSIDRNKIKSKSYQGEASSSKPAENLSDFEISFSEDVAQEEPHPEV
jgi:hypothetical protein